MYEEKELFNIIYLYLYFTKSLFISTIFYPRPTEITIPIGENCLFIILTCITEKNIDMIIIIIKSI